MSESVWAAEDALRGRLAADLRAALKSRDAAATSAIRTLAAALDNAGAVAVDPDRKYVPTAGPSVEVTRRTLSEADLAAIIAREIAERERAIADYEAGSRKDAADRLRADIAVIGRYGAAPTPPG